MSINIALDNKSNRDKYIPNKNSKQRRTKTHESNWTISDIYDTTKQNSDYYNEPTY